MRSKTKYLAKLYQRSQFDKKNSQPWLITEAIERNDKTFLFKSREVTQTDFSNIKSSLFNGQQVSFINVNKIRIFLL